MCYYNELAYIDCLAWSEITNKQFDMEKKPDTLTLLKLFQHCPEISYNNPVSIVYCANKLHLLIVSND